MCPKAPFSLLPLCLAWLQILPLVSLSQPTVWVYPGALDDLVDVHQLAGMSVVTRCGDDLSTEFYGGFRDIFAKLPVDPSTNYRIASISKAVVALAAAKLDEQGNLDLDAPIGNVLEAPPFHPNYPETPLTLRHLLTHTSGIRDGDGYGTFLSDTYSAIPDVPSLSSVLGEGGAYHTANMWGPQEPGTYFQYANLNFGVAATVLEAATGVRFDVLMEDLLFAPYGLDAGFRVQDLDNIADLAVLYRQQDGEWVAQVDDYGGVMPGGPDWSEYIPGTSAVGFAPQGGLRTNARDLTTLARLWSHGTAPGADGTLLTFLGPDALAELKSPQWSYDGSNGSNYYGLFNQWANGIHLAASGLGQDEIIPDVEIAPFIGHPGEAYGLISDAYATPDGAWSFAFLTNGKWEGYAAGLASAYYAVEQDVFAALQEDLLQCLTVKVPEMGAALTVIGSPRVGDTLVELRAPGWNGPVDFEIVDSAGRSLWSGPVTGMGEDRLLMEVPPLPGGILIGRLSHRTTATGGHPRGLGGRFIMLVTG